MTKVDSGTDADIALKSRQTFFLYSLIAVEPYLVMSQGTIKSRCQVYDPHGSRIS